ncbi:MAG: hypothetical protein JW976_06425 [Syntrophaceae bacterium]|nr:hypothetical protein [Syntrophaceae bacterium]
MTKPFYNRLNNYFSQIGKVLKGEADSASIFQNTTDVGVSREKVYANILKLHLPTCCNVDLGGFVFDLDGNESKQIDIIICNEQTIRFNFFNTDGSGKSFSCIDGCIGVVSVKSNLNSNELIDSLNNFASLPDKCPLEGRNNPLIVINDYEEWPFKIIFASAGITPETSLSTINTFYLEHPEIPLYKRPNIIHVAGKYLIIRVGKEGGQTSNGTLLPPNSFFCQTVFPDEFGIPFVISRIQTIATSTNNLIYNFEKIWKNLPLSTKEND